MKSVIDADALKNEFADVLGRNYTDDYGKGFVAGLCAALDRSTLPQPSNEALTLEKLREMDGPVWVACKPIEGGDGYWCLCRYGTITTPAATVFDAGEIPHWVFYRRPPKGET